MHNVERVAVVDGVDNRSDCLFCLRLRVALLFENVVEKLKLTIVYLTPGHQFHNQVVTLFVFVNIEQFDDVWVVHLLQNFYLRLQSQLVFIVQALPNASKPTTLTS